MLRLSSFIVLLTLFVTFSGCNKNVQQANSSATTEVLQIAPEDVVTLRTDAFASGPTITGSIQPERKADLRAEVASVVLQVLKENGEKVKKGDLLVRLDDTAIRDNLHSAQQSERAAMHSLEQAKRQLERSQKLRESGMVSMQALEDAETKRNNARSELAAARASTVQARQQLQRTEIRAPFEGVVSERQVSNGDTAQIGKELIKVIDPTDMRFEGLVSADAVGKMAIGQKVNFRINGYPGQLFTGIVKRINPQANPTTRQVEVLVDFSDSKQPQVSGLYAEGQIEAGNVAALMIPESAFQRNGDDVIAWKVKDHAIHKTAITLGERDMRTGNYIVKSGLNDGDVVIRHPVTTLVDKQKIEFVRK
jgi:membrane fusion protein, multidrug efflux system